MDLPGSYVNFYTSVSSSPVMSITFPRHTSTKDKYQAISQAIQKISLNMNASESLSTLEVYDYFTNQKLDLATKQYPNLRDILLVKRQGSYNLTPTSDFNSNSNKNQDSLFSSSQGSFRKINTAVSPVGTKGPTAEVASNKENSKSQFHPLLKLQTSPARSSLTKGRASATKYSKVIQKTGDFAVETPFGEELISNGKSHMTIQTNKKLLESNGFVQEIEDEKFKTIDYRCKTISENGVDYFRKPIDYNESLCVIPNDGTNPCIYSSRLSLPFTYLICSNENRYDPRAPPPTYVNYSVLSKQRPTEKNLIFKGIEITSLGEIKCVDEEILKKSKGILSEVFKKLFSSVTTEGESLGRINIPIRVFEARSIIERVADAWAFAPFFLQPACRDTSPLERMKKVISFTVAGLYVSSSQLKPFNPLLGETYQGYFPGYDIQIFNEQISHHPAVTSFLMVGKEFRMYGKYEFAIRFEGNHFRLQQEGPATVEFADGEKITFFVPELKVGGMFYGDRTCKFVRTMKFIDTKNKLKAVIKMNAGVKVGFFGKKRSDLFHGKIYNYKEIETKTKESKISRKDKKRADLKMLDMEESLADIEGSWLESLNIGGQETWHIDKFLPVWHLPVKVPLPSDFRYREDLIWVLHGNNKYAEEWKMKLEHRQRTERSLREELIKKHKKKK